MSPEAEARVAVLIPAYNAGAALGVVLEKTLQGTAAEDVWVVDDGSTDDTPEIARRHGVRLIRQKPNMGKAAALRRGFRSTREYDCVITMDADGQHHPEDLQKFRDALGTGDLIVGARPLGGRMPWHRQVGNRIASWITTALAGQWIPDSQSGYRMHTRDLVDSVVHLIPKESGGYLFETEILVRAARQGYKVGSVPIPAVYEDEQSHFHPFREVPRFLGLFLRLGWDLLRGELARRPKPQPGSRGRTRTSRGSKP